MSRMSHMDGAISHTILKHPTVALFTMERNMGVELCDYCRWSHLHGRVIHGKLSEEYPDPHRQLQHLLHNTMLLIINEFSLDLDTQMSDTTQTHLLLIALIDKFDPLAVVAINNGVDVELVNSIRRDNF